jgi:hypothetical protein
VTGFEIFWLIFTGIFVTGLTVTSVSEDLRDVRLAKRGYQMKKDGTIVKL